MNRLLTIGLLLLSSAYVKADTLLNYVEYKIQPKDVIAFSSQGIRVRLCDLCEPRNIKVLPSAEFFDRNQTINLKMATERYVSKNYPFVSVFIDRTKWQTDRVVFGGHDELEISKNIQNLEKQAGEKHEN